MSNPSTLTLPTTLSPELIELEKLLEEDIRNNSAWSHRYFCVFGIQELEILESPSNLAAPKPLLRKDLFSKRNGGNRSDADGNLLLVPPEVMEREVQYAQTAIQRTPQNPSPWNYLRGVVRRCDIPSSQMRGFCEGFVWESHENAESNANEESKANSKLDFEGESVRSSHAIAWLGEIYREEGTQEGREQARRAWDSLGRKWDPIRRNYWEWRCKEVEREG